MPTNQLKRCGIVNIMTICGMIPKFTACAQIRDCHEKFTALGISDNVVMC